MEWEKHLIFRSNLNVELFETNTVSEDLIRSYNELGYENVDGRKDYFEFFHWVSKYLLNNNKDIYVFKNVVNQYKSINPISTMDEELIELSFKINEMVLDFDGSVTENCLEMINACIEKCSALSIIDKATLLALHRLKLRYLLRDIGGMTEARANELKVAKNEVESLLVADLVEGKEEEVVFNTIFLV